MIRLSIPVRRSNARVAHPVAGGFSLIEILIAIVLGLLLTAGIVTVFIGTGKTNRAQDRLARLQENGRYALTRVDADMRMVSAQYCSNFAGLSVPSSNGPQISQRAPWFYAASLSLPDAGTTPMTFAVAAPLSPRLFVQGYECGSGSCAPAVPSGASQIPPVGTTNGTRLRGTDVLTIRYITGTGWPVTVASCAPAGTINADPQLGDDHTMPVATNPITNVLQRSFSVGDLALVTDCMNPTIVPIAGAGLYALTVGAALSGGPGVGPFCTASANRDTRVFNFTKNFVTVTYDVELVNDTNPDATPGRLIPVLMRRENGNPSELVQGVERLDFVYGVRDINGAIRYLTADQVNAQSRVATCSAPPAGVALEAGCLWRSVKSVEVHALFDTVDDMGSLAPEEMSYRYSIDGSAIAPPAGATSPITGLPFGRMLRREFVSVSSVRNAN